eukprot:COSAG01_NODE_28504_length_659_cov_1.621429_1_plen_101_part_01
MLIVSGVSGARVLTWPRAMGRRKDGSAQRLPAAAPPIAGWLAAICASSWAAKPLALGLDDCPIITKQFIFPQTLIESVARLELEIPYVISIDDSPPHRPAL